jgi:hypothetical protein
MWQPASTSAKPCPACGYPIARREFVRKASSTIKHIFQRREIPLPQLGTVRLISPEVTNTLTTGMVNVGAPFSLARINGCGQGMAGFIPALMVDGKIIGLSMPSFYLFYPNYSVGLALSVP